MIYTSQSKGTRVGYHEIKLKIPLSRDSIWNYYMVGVTERQW